MKRSRKGISLDSFFLGEGKKEKERDPTDCKLTI